MPKRIVYTKITPLAKNVPRQLALDMLHSHGEIIELNPLVTGHKPIAAPRTAARDEYFAQWYEIEEVITWGLGMRKKISFKGVFHDMPWGLQTHIYAPMGVDLRNKYTIAGNQPGEPREAKELGVDAPPDGLYLREDVEITCNIALASFVKKETKQTLLTMIERMTKKAELLDDGVLQAMFENGRLKTRNPQLANAADSFSSPSSMTLGATASDLSVSPTSPAHHQVDFSPNKTFTRYSMLPGRTSTQRASIVGPQELDTKPITDASGDLHKPFHNAVEMEGSSSFMPVGDFLTGAPVIHAELADTSTPHDPRRPSAQSTTSAMSSLDPHNSSLQPTPSFNSHNSTQSHVTASSQYSTASNNVVPAPLRPRGSDASSHVGPASVSGNSYVIANPSPRGHARTPSYQSVVSYDPHQQAGGGAAPSPPLTYQPQGLPPTVYQAYSRDAARDVLQTGTDELASQAGGLNISGTSPPKVQIVPDPMDLPEKTVKCPICDFFEGDSAAVSHHVNRFHF